MEHTHDTMSETFPLRQACYWRSSQHGGALRNISLETKQQKEAEEQLSLPG